MSDVTWAREQLKNACESIQDDFAVGRASVDPAMERASTPEMFNVVGNELRALGERLGTSHEVSTHELIAIRNWIGKVADTQALIQQGLVRIEQSQACQAERTSELTREINTLRTGLELMEAAQERRNKALISMQRGRRRVKGKK